MATAGDVCTRASRRIGILADEETLTSSQMTHFLEMLNDMLHGFGPKGIQYAHTTLTQTQTINFPDEQVGNVILMMAQQLLQEYPVAVSQELKEAMAAAKTELQAAYLVINPAMPDRALRRRRPGWLNFETA